VVFASQLGAKREEVSAIEEKISALEDERQTLERGLGPKPAAPLTPEQQHEAWQERLRPPHEELARVEAELARMHADTAARGLTLYPETSTGSPTSILLRQLETQATTLRQQIETMEDEAHRAGVPPGWLR
jgi:DNA repair exonuclease SbcCD ATPase subunit